MTELSSLSKYIAIWMVSVFISSVAHDRKIKEYLNPIVITAYGIFFASTLLTMYALKYVPLTMSPIVESCSYIFVPILGIFILKEKISRRKWLGMAIMVAGIFIFTLGG